MNNEEIKVRLLKVFSDNGNGFVCENENREILLDSIEFVSLIVEIEKEFKIEVPEEYLSIEKLKTFSQYFEMVKNIEGKAEDALPEI